MSQNFENVDRFVAGTVGQPGERQFFLQIRSGKRLITASLEKAQVQALAERIDILLKQIAKEDFSISNIKIFIDDQPLEQPIENDFSIGAISIAWESEIKVVVVEFYAINDVDSTLGEDDEEPEITFALTVAQAKSFVSRSNAVVGAGRLPCPFCGIPIDPRGHLCPRANGYRR